MAYLIVLAALAAFMAYMRFEASNLQVNRIRFTKSGKGLKIIQLSDIHIKYLRVDSARVKAVISEEAPDMVIITGDYIEKPKDTGAFLDFLDETDTGVPVFLCLGNHDYKAFKGRASHCDKAGLDEFIEQIKARKIEVLHNKSVCFKKNSRKYNIIGIDDLKEGSPDVAGALQNTSPGAFMNIAFTHNPDTVFDIPKGKVDMLLCGHFHGGQIWAPFDLEFRLLRSDRLCKMGVKRGLHRVNGINLYINRGLGNVCFPLRFLSRPEITVYQFQ